jgi:drug/metabolite transporter (DMT)-like permease
MKFIPGSLAGVLIYIAVPIAYILDVAFLGTKVGTLELCGVAIIVLTNMLIGIIEYCKCCPDKPKIE